jgi:anti-sigma factor RsiW
MSISDETLMAYADGEADAATRASVESAMQTDPEIAQRVARHRAMREAMRGAFADVLREPVPDRLVAAARGRSTASVGTAGIDDTVVDFAGVLAAAAALKKARGARRWQPFALAASLLLGIGVGFLTWHGSGTVVESDARGLVAGAALSKALSSQLSEDRGASLAAVTGLSFRDKSGAYCRTFSLNGSGAAAGLACRDGAQWRIKALAQSTEAQGGGNFRTAASPLPPLIRAAVEEAIKGEPLDRAAEIAARQSGWSAPAPSPAR